jgi:hypothetical protein
LVSIKKKENKMIRKNENIEDELPADVVRFNIHLQRFEVIHFILQFYLYLKDKYPLLVFDVENIDLMNKRLDNRKLIKQLLDEAQIDKKTGEYEWIEVPKDYNFRTSMWAILNNDVRIIISYKKQESDMFNIKHILFLYNEGDAENWNDNGKQIYFTSFFSMEHNSKTWETLRQKRVSYEMLCQYKGREEELMHYLEKIMHESKFVMFREMIGIT